MVTSRFSLWSQLFSCRILPFGEIRRPARQNYKKRVLASQMRQCSQYSTTVLRFQAPSFPT